jgi:alpha/beta superfamily hydrolase
MHNKVVFAAARGVLAAGWSALRFNFRGIGRSQGQHDGGRGETLDAAAALTAAARMHPGLPLLAAGFSFGSVMAMAAGAAQPGVIALAALGLPTRMTAVEHAPGVTLPLLIVQGELDEFAVLEEVRAFSASWRGPVDLVVVAGADHFFKGRLDEVESALERFCRRLAEGADSVPAPSGAAPGGGA